MKWQGKRENSNIEDRRGEKTPIAKGATGVLGFIIVLVVAYYGIDLSDMVALQGNLTDTNTNNSQVIQQPTKQPLDEVRLNQFAKAILAETEDVWKSKIPDYQPPTMVLYRGSTKTSCGIGQAVMGPFYCPTDQKVYIDLSFYDDMRNKLHADGEFALAYVIAHEVGHHVQNLLDNINQIKQNTNLTANQISVKIELQADCFAGIWAREVDKRNLLEDDDINNAFVAAQAVGNDRLQQHSGQVIPDSFTHGSSAQRLYWFKKGFTIGEISACDTFND